MFEEKQGTRQRKDNIFPRCFVFPLFLKNLGSRKSRRQNKRGGRTKCRLNVCVTVFAFVSQSVGSMFVGSASLLFSSSTSASASPSLTSFSHLNIICWKEAKSSMGFPDPPPFVDHLDIGYDVIRVEADLVVSLGLVVVQGDGSDTTTTTTS